MVKKLLRFCSALFCCLLLFSQNIIAQAVGPMDITCPYEYKDFVPTAGKDCVYFLNLHDSANNGWDGASVDVSIASNVSTNYKMTVSDGSCKLIPIYVNDGETIDITYWNGANETEHGLALYNSNGDSVLTTVGLELEFAGNIPANQTMRVKADCPNASCSAMTEQFDVVIRMGANPEEQSWELYEGTATEQGPQITAVTAGTYTGLAPGSTVTYPVNLEKCKEYTFVTFDAANNGWGTGSWYLRTNNSSYGTPINTSGVYYSLLGGSSSSTGERRGFTVPCAPVCEDVNMVSVNGSCISLMDLPIAAPVVCYPACEHADCSDMTVEHFVIPRGGAGGYTGLGAAVGGEDAAIGGNQSMGIGVLEAGPLAGPSAETVAFPEAKEYEGILIDANNDDLLNADDAGFIPVGAHLYITEYTYCDGVVVRCTAALNIVLNSNPTMTCNDNVIVSLGAPSSNTLNECRVGISPDMVLENTSGCSGEYIVTVFAEDGSSLGNSVGPNQLMQTLTYTIEHILSGNVCWGTLTVEDKLDPTITVNDYFVPCTHPEALNEFYTNSETYNGVELPANIVGGSGVLGGTSNTYIPINIGCGNVGEIIQNIAVTVNVAHTDLSDLQLLLHTPASIASGPITLAATGKVKANNVFVAAPNAPLNVLNVVLNQACTNATSTSPEYYVTENTGSQLPTNIDGTWYIQVIDSDLSGTFVGGGEVTAASITLTCGFPQPYEVYDCSLQGVELISEMVLESHCDQSEWYGSVIERVWQATDKYGSTTTALQTVSLKAPTLDEVRMPGDVHIECTDNLSGDLTPAQTGIPAFGCNDLTEDLHGLCDISYTYTDNTLPTCGLGYKIVRRWTIINWCSGVNQYYEQLIKVEDTVGPGIAQGDVSVGANTNECTGDVDFGDLGLIDACSDISSVIASYIEGGGSYIGNGNLVVVDLTNGGILTGLPIGVTEVTISAKDVCLNQTDKLIRVTVVDDVLPVAICDDELHISLGSDGTALLDVEDIDEGSYDNCGVVSLLVRRTDGCLGQSDWAETVPFDCCDRDQLVTVEMRVTDAAGNTNVCWKDVLVEDALAPIITCAPDKTLDCDSPEIHDPFGEPTFLDNCTAEIISTLDGGELDQCKAGTLTRTWTVSDGSDKSVDATCTQRVTVRTISDFIIQFPADATINDCIDPGNTGEPTVTDEDCELIAISSEDFVLTTVEDACYKIERRWTVINWCVYDQGNASNTDLGTPQPLPRTYQDDDGYFTYVQTIKVLDTTNPIFSGCPDNLNFCDLTDGCEGQADLTIVAEDGCTTENDITYTYKIDANNDGSFDIIGEGNDASGVYPYGTHLIKWIAEDGCGNTGTCAYTFTIEDCKNPTPVCLHGITMEIEETGCTDIWASDLLEYAFDNCSDVDYVESSVRMRRINETSAPQSSMTLCCDDLGAILVEIWVEDEAGNADFCQTYLILQDNQETCPSNNTVAVAGTIATEAGQAIEDAMVEIEGGMLDEMPTAVNGEFAFNVPMNANYTVTPNLDVDPLNGVSTFDIVLIGQHILGLSEFTNPYQMVAADVNNDGNITTFDIVQTRQLILYTIQDFPANTSWRFIDADYEFPVATNPWFETFPERIDLANITLGQLVTDFIGVKIGDVNGDAVANTLVGTEDRNLTGTLVLTIDDAELTSGNKVSVDVRATDFDLINGYQFTLNFDAAAMNFTGVKAGVLNVTEGNFGLAMLNEGVLTTSWNGEATKVANDEVLFTLDFDVKADVVLSDALQVNSRYTVAEAYQGNDLMDVAIAFNTTEGTVVSGGTFELYQNTPNPFSTETMIGFTLPEAATATLKVYDVAGKVLKIVAGDFERGYNQISLRSNDIQASGVLYYQLDTPEHTATKKMIILE